MAGHRFRGNEAEQLALSTYVKLRRAANALTERLAAPMVEAGLTETQFGVLEALYHLGPMCQSDVARRILTSTGNVTLVVDKLEGRGLVRRVRLEDDRRYVELQLTAEGAALIKGFFPGHARRVAEAMAALPAAEQKVLGRLCRQLGLAQSEAQPA